jgi:hypothetical protein
MAGILQHIFEHINPSKGTGRDFLSSEGSMAMDDFCIHHN